MTILSSQSARSILRRRFVVTAAGHIHVAMAGQGLPVLLFHQTPRSWDEYRDVIPLLATHYQPIAMDTIGFGDSYRPPVEEHSIERWASAAFDMLDALGIERAAVVGHHTGAATAMEMAVRRPDRIVALVLSSCSLNDAHRRAAHGSHRTIDEVDKKHDGAHLGELWSRRQPYYPKGNIDLLERYIIDALKAGEMASLGHKIVGRYEMERSLPLLKLPTLIIDAVQDPHASPYAKRLAESIAGSQLVQIDGGMVPLPDQMPEEFSKVISIFLAQHIK